MNLAYLFVPILVIMLLAYFTTWLFVKWGIFSLKTHRKSWNHLLLVTFLVSGILGLLGVIKINYKLHIPHYDQLLYWHVSFGVAMAVIAFFHLSWHLKYYFSKTAKSPQLPDKLCKSLSGVETTTDNQASATSASFIASSNEMIPLNLETVRPEWAKARYLLILLGAVAMINQVVFIREFLSVLNGNELILGMVLSGWLVLTAWGAYLARRQTLPDFSSEKGINLLAFLSLVPAVLIVLLYGLKSMLFPPGTIAGIGISLAGIFLLLFPVCFLSGYLFTNFSTLYSLSKNENRIGKAYAYESLGSLVGGLLFSLLLGRFLNSFQIFGITTGVVLITGAWIAANKKVAKRIGLLVIGILIPTLTFLFNPDIHVKRLFYPNQEIISSQNTPYGNLIITRQAGQLNFYENNSLQFYTDNTNQSEEAVHFAMVQHPDPKQILLISGGISGMIKEVKKYPVEKITYLESNPEIFRQWKNHTNTVIDMNHVEFVDKDIRTFLKNTTTIYDVILINLPDPSTLGYNRFYTQEFFSIVKKHCNNQSILCTSLPSTMNYAESNALAENASLWNTLGCYFANRLLLPGEKNYFLASDNQLSYGIARSIKDKSILNEYINSDYMDDKLMEKRGQALVSQFNSNVPVNRDFYPFMFIKQVNHWVHYMGVNYQLIILVPLIAFIILVIGYKPVAKGVFIAGFTSTSLEMLLMLAYQVYFGSLYLTSALFFSVFMGAMALGSWYNPKKSGKNSTRKLAGLLLLLALFALLVPFFNLAISKINGFNGLIQILFFIPVFLLAFIIGFIFRHATQIQDINYQQTAGTNYSADLTGSALGVFLVTLFLLPLFGFTNTCLAIAGLNFIVAIFIYLAIKKTGSTALV